MPTFRVLIDTDNAAFADPFTGEYDPYTEGLEIASILRHLADQLAEDPSIDHPLRDSNGNTVGRAQFVQHR